ncbi:hypothetical protein HPB51_004044 [Rhipicephalus microplus]|uniref:Uncharacterized protein n=1 Tax=Rhipicephalus microplus TaxID=6941 RepID=A0A9J6EXI6_RHIMP|nr:hypothetical protein HPB51_004044 [Rhipicephalus microplus]
MQNDASPSLLAQKVDRLEHELESTSKLLRQANRELARREASLAQLGRHNERLRGRVARLESDVAVYRAASSAAATASSSSSSGEEEDAVAANAEIDVSADARPTRCCSARDKELLRTLAGIYDKISISGPRKGDSVVDGGKWYAFGKNHRHVGRSLPDAHVLEQVFANFWQEYRSMSSELESCKQVVANQELRIGYLEAQVDAANRIKTQEFFDADVLRKGADNGAVGMNASVRFGENCDIALNGDTCSAPVGGRCAALVNVERRVAEESHLLARLGRLQLDNSRLQVLNREVLTREAAVKKELQRVQNKVSCVQGVPVLVKRGSRSAALFVVVPKGWPSSTSNMPVHRFCFFSPQAVELQDGSSSGYKEDPGPRIELHVSSRAVLSSSAAKGPTTSTKGTEKPPSLEEWPTLPTRSSAKEPLQVVATQEPSPTMEDLPKTDRQVISVLRSLIEAIRTILVDMKTPSARSALGLLDALSPVLESLN